MSKNLTALIILDGYGLTDNIQGNAVYQHSPYINNLINSYPSCTLNASGLDVGLPQGQMGNSEVGHLNIGAGRIIYQDLTRISKSIDDDDFFTNEEFLTAINNTKANKSKLHLMGLLSDGGVHTHISHLYALLELCKRNNFSDVFIHCYLDGRDTLPTSAVNYLAQLLSKIDELGVGKIATICGRYYAMDRDNNWERVQKAYKMLTQGIGIKATDAISAIKSSYNNGVTDEFVLPTVVFNGDKPTATITSGDSVIFFNFRADRARELTRAFTMTNFDKFETTVNNVTWVGFTKYDDSFDKVLTAYKQVSINNTVGDYLSSLGLTQLRIAETEKYAHVTFFFNGGIEESRVGEIRELVPSPKVATYDLMPQMSAYEVTDKALQYIDKGNIDFMVLNYANCDMVGHTGVIDAAQKAVEVVDGCLQKIVDAILAKGGRLFVTADHGNAEQMLDEFNKPFTQHTTNLVPFILVDNRLKGSTLVNGRLADISPTILSVMGLQIPPQMTGKNLLKR